MVRPGSRTWTRTCLLAQEHGSGCFLYDKLMVLQDEWAATTESGKFSPRIEDLLEKLSSGPMLRGLIRQLLKKMLQGHRAAHAFRLG